MKITIESTDQITYLDGVHVRAWNGVTDNGAKCVVFVHRVAVHDSEDQWAFEREMKETLPPGHVIDLRHIL